MWKYTHKGQMSPRQAAQIQALQTMAGELRGHVCVTAYAPDLSGAWCQAEDVSFALASSVKAKFISTRVLGNRQL